MVNQLLRFRILIFHHLSLKQCHDKMIVVALMLPPLEMFQSLIVNLNRFLDVACTLLLIRNFHACLPVFARVFLSRTHTRIHRRERKKKRRKHDTKIFTRIVILFLHHENPNGGMTCLHSQIILANPLNWIRRIVVRQSTHFARMENIGPRFSWRHANRHVRAPIFHTDLVVCDVQSCPGTNKIALFAFPTTVVRAKGNRLPDSPRFSAFMLRIFGTKRTRSMQTTRSNLYLHRVVFQPQKLGQIRGRFPRRKEDEELF